MARIESYNLDDSISGNDKFIGTDTTGLTKNFSLHSITNWLNDSGSVSILGQNNYFFQEQASNPNARLEGSISFENFGGAETNFSDITSLVFSSKNAAGISNEEFITGFIGKSVLLAQLDDYNNFGVYELSSFTPVVNESGFYKATLSFKNGSGFIKPSKNYGFALYEFSAQIYERSSYPVVSPDGTSFIIVAGNDGTLAAIPPTSTAPSITTLPTISGTLNVGETLTATAGTTSGVPTPTRVLQWQRSDNGTTGWADISGATGTTYLLAFNDEDKYIRVAQTEENILGTATANSASTEQIQPVTALLLDDYPNAAAAYSLRKLRVLHSGDAIVVRRASDNATQSIGFLANSELDTTSLESFCAGTDGFVTTWFDQSGSGNDATQTTAGSQPKIVSSGSTILEGGKAALSFDGSNDFLVSAFSSPISTTTASIVFKGPANDFIFDSNDTVNRNSLVLMPDGFNFRLFFGSGSPGQIFHSIAPDVWGDRHLGSFISDAANSTLGIDGSFTAVSNTTSVTMNGITLGSAATGLIPLQGTMQEAVIYGSNQSANLSGIETNINAFYTIY